MPEESAGDHHQRHVSPTIKKSTFGGQFRLESQASVGRLEYFDDFIPR